MGETKTVVESNHYIVLENFMRRADQAALPMTYQTEADLERELLCDLAAQGYERPQHLASERDLLDNARDKLQLLNGVTFSPAEWERFVRDYLDRPGESMLEKTRRVHANPVLDFRFDDGRVQNIRLFDRAQVARNQVQVLSQVSVRGVYANRYDVVILVNGLPLVLVELKRRGVGIREAFQQVHRYSHESLSSGHTLFGYVQLFVISNGTDTRYFANTVRREKSGFDFTMRWATAQNEPIMDLKDFTATFLQKNTLLHVLLTYSVFDSTDTLLVLRPYQIAAVERILWRIQSAYLGNQWSSLEAGGYIWHTTGSGKTLTSFKAAQLATRLPFIDRVFFVVDRKDLDYQTMREYQRFSPDSVNGSDSTAGLRRNLEAPDGKIVVTTIQKLNNLMRSESELSVYGQQVVFIFDEAHRSQFGEAQRNLRRRFKRYYQFGFTGTPIFVENAQGNETTAKIFGPSLHEYVITHAIRDGKVLKFKVDYNAVRPRFCGIECEIDAVRIGQAETRELMLHPHRIEEIARYILQQYHLKTLRGGPENRRGFNALFAVGSIAAAKAYYRTLLRLQEDTSHPLRIATIFSLASDEGANAFGHIADEGFNPDAMDQSSKAFLAEAIGDYNALFGTNYGVEEGAFQNYYRDLALRVRQREVDLLIVVGMFLTGFDAPLLNTLFVDKPLRYHGLLQAFSRTNRIYDATKAFGNIVCFRNLEQATLDALRLFGEEQTRYAILEYGFQEYLEGFVDALSQERQRGYREVVEQLVGQFPRPDRIRTEKEKRAFVELFGEYLRIESKLQHFDQFAYLRPFQSVDRRDPEAVRDFQARHFLTDEQMAQMRDLPVISERAMQDYCSTYHDIRAWHQHQQGDTTSVPEYDWSGVTFEVELLKSLEIDLDYILELLLAHRERARTVEELFDEARRLIRSSESVRAKEELVIDFLRCAPWATINDLSGMLSAFFAYAQAQQRREAEAIIAEEGLSPAEGRRYLMLSLRQGHASELGTALNAALPHMSPLSPEYLPTKQRIYRRIADFVRKYEGVGGEV